MADTNGDASKEVFPLSWHVSVLGLYLVVMPFVFEFSGTYKWSVIVAGILIVPLAAWRSWQPDEKVPQPHVPLAVVLLGLYTIATPFLFGKGIGDIPGISLVILGVVFVVLPAPEALRTMR